MRNLIKRTIFAAIIFTIVATLAQGAFLPTPEKLTLKNGIVVYYLKNSDLPLISFRMWIKGAGTANEPANLEGVSNLTATLLLKGTTTKDANAIAEALDFMGARFSITSADEYAGVSAESLAEHFPKLLEIAADCLMNPSFKDDEFAKERKTRLDSLRAVKDNPAAAVRNYFQKAYFGSHPMGHLASGTETSLNQIMVADLKSYYQKYLRPERCMVAVVGDIEKTKLVDLLNATIGAWKGVGEAAALAPIPQAPKPAGKKLILIDKPDATQAYWVLGAPGYPMGDKVTPQADVMNTLFGGRFTSWLSTELRIKRGLTYGASSSFRTWSVGGLFSASSYTRNEKIGEMLDITFDLLKKVRKDGFAAEETESARNYLQGQFPPTLESNASKATAFLRLVFYNLGFDYYDKYLANIQKVSQTAAKEAAGSLIPESDFVLVVVGKAADIKKQLDKYGTWTEKKITDPGF
ncbi:MAG: pitrilysin family protein [Acidobacteriota bacterium]|jgi:predicted Zn-dependent peptidase